jgi:LuxR family maltose regulon positive regulatory protein
LTKLLDELRPSRSVSITRLQVTLVYIHIISADLERALLTNKELYDFSRQNKYLYANMWSLYLNGLIYFYQSKFGEAVQYFQEALSKKYLLHTRAVVDGMTGLALAYQHMLRDDLADHTIKRLVDYTASLEDPGYTMIAQSCRIRISILRGDIKTALSLWHQDSPPLDENMVWWLEIPGVTVCRAMIADGSAERLAICEKRLQALLDLNRKNHNIIHTIEILVLSALTLEKMNRRAEALECLEEAVTLAEPGGIRQFFMEPGQPLDDLLHQLQRQEGTGGYIDEILTAAEVGDTVMAGDSIGTPTKPSTVAPSPADGPRAPRPQPLIEPLTNRELDVLEWLAKRMTDKEIAEELCISPVTVNSHLKNIYQKLCVGNRRQAVLKAKELGLV